MGPIVRLHGSATGATHVEILRKYALPTMKRMFPRNNGLFQEDNARPHKTKVASSFCAEKNLHILSWPAQSPDLNPIENLWADIKKNIRAYKKPPLNLADLNCYVKKAWREIPMHTIENLVDSMPQRIQAVMKQIKV
jgi:transposase